MGVVVESCGAGSIGILSACEEIIKLVRCVR